MSKGMYCSASQKIDSASSASVITGRLIFLTITALPESDAATSLHLKALFWNRRRIASATAVPSMIAPSTMLSGGAGSLAKAATLYDFPAAFSSTALTALDPMSSPTTALGLPRPSTAPPHPQSGYQSQRPVNRRKFAECRKNCDPRREWLLARITIPSRDHESATRHTRWRGGFVVTYRRQA